jgi:hypothetical protein
VLTTTLGTASPDAADLVYLGGRELPGGGVDADVRMALRELVQTLPEREQEVLCLLYSLDGKGTLNCREIGERLFMVATASHVARVKHEALERLRQRLHYAERWELAGTGRGGMNS